MYHPCFTTKKTNKYSQINSVFGVSILGSIGFHRGVDCIAHEKIKRPVQDHNISTGICTVKFIKFNQQTNFNYIKWLNLKYLSFPRLESLTVVSKH